MKKKIMYLWSILSLIFVLLSCKTYHVYVIDFNEPSNTHALSLNESENRFSKQFKQADSIFMLKLREASKEAVLKTNQQIYDNNTNKVFR